MAAKQDSVKQKDHVHVSYGVYMRMHLTKKMHPENQKISVGI